jgi:type I restriction enzyme S subunit
VKTATLANVATLSSGGTPPRTSAESFGAGTPWVSITDLNDGLVEHTKESLTAFGIANSAAKSIPPGTLLVAMYGASIGKLGVAGTTLCTNQAIAAIQPDDNELSGRYLYHYLLAQRKHLRARGRGGAQPNISLGDLQNWPIPLPELSEQRRIAAILDQADGLRTKRRQVLTNIEGLSTSIFNQMFGSGSAVNLTPLNSVVHRITYGFTNPVTHVHSGIPIVTAKSIRAERIDLESGNFTTQEDFLALSDKSRPRKGDVLITKDGTIGRCAVVDAASLPFCINQSVALVRPRLEVIEPDFLLGYLTTDRVQAAMNRMGKGNALKHLQITELAKMLLPCPSKEDQRTYAARVDHIRQLHLTQLGVSDCERELFESLQSRAFSGQL